MINAISFHKIFKASTLPTVVLLPDAPRFTIAEVNEPILKNTFIKEEDLIGKGLFEAFPENPNEQFSNSIPNLSKSLQQLIETQQPDKMGIQKYDMALTGNGEYEERYW